MNYDDEPMIKISRPIIYLNISCTKVCVLSTHHCRLYQRVCFEWSPVRSSCRVILHVVLWGNWPSFLIHLFSHLFRHLSQSPILDTNGSMIIRKGKIVNGSFGRSKNVIFRSLGKLQSLAKY